MKASINSLQHHWDDAYTLKETSKLGWFEESSEPTLTIIKSCKLNKKARILNVGSGSSVLIDELVDLGFSNVIASDLSKESLKNLQNRMASKKDAVDWIVDDLTNPKVLSEIKPIDLWNDRAVLHFFTEEKDQDTYFSLLKKLVKPSGYVIISVFNTEGATKCCGLPVKRYDKGMLTEKLGSDFTLIDSFNYIYTNPYGDARPYVYTLFKKK
ncbi:MAG: class I SAM-dependent methyltransferase [Flavobacteriaceae bacterium]|nr:class I SAM-dependent methyltransferase [Flavobacteriaceae bacterium]